MWGGGGEMFQNVPLTLFLFPPFASVANFDGADRNNDGNNEEKDSAWNNS